MPGSLDLRQLVRLGGMRYVSMPHCLHRELAPVAAALERSWILTWAEASTTRRPSRPWTRKDAGPGHRAWAGAVP
jgi:hypothetical protein